MKRALMIIEDELIHQKNIEKVLGKTYGDTYEILVAGTGAEAMQQLALHHKKIDLIFLDINLPDKTGPEVFAEMSTRIATMPNVIMVTAFDQSDEVISAMLGMGASDYIVKPFKLGEFREKVRKVLEGQPKPSGNAKDMLVKDVLDERNTYYLEAHERHFKTGVVVESIDDFLASYKKSNSAANKTVEEVLAMFEEDTGARLPSAVVSKVLYVDDEPDQLAVSKKFLDSHDQFELVCSQSLEEAREAIKENKFDIFIIDLTLRDGSGSDFIEELHSLWNSQGIEESSRPEIIILSGDNSNESIVRLSKQGINKYLVKPITKNDLLETLRDSHYLTLAVKVLPTYLTFLKNLEVPFRYRTNLLFNTGIKSKDLKSYKKFLPELTQIPDSNYKKINLTTPTSFLRSIIDLQSQDILQK